MLRIGVIGYGYWGPNLARNLSETPGCEVAAICDFLPNRLDLARGRHPGVKTTTHATDILEDPSISAVAVATHVSTHFELAMAALRAGKHVLVEKPLTQSSDQALQLIEEARRRKLILLVDHTFVYTGAVRKIRELVETGRLGEVLYYDSVRINLGLFQQDVNVVWDLAVHDLSILDYILEFKPCAVSASGVCHVEGQPENIAFITLFFDAPVIAHVHVNWLAPVKVRRTLVGGSKNMIVYDDLEPSEKIKVYDKGVTLEEEKGEAAHPLHVSYRSGDMWAPRLDLTEALRIQARHFAHCVRTGETPLSDGVAGLRIVNILEAATRSMAGRGQLTEIDHKGETA